MKRKKALRIASILKGKDPDAIEIGDKVRVSSGPYYVAQNGERYSMGEVGLFKITSTVKDGYMAKPLDSINYPCASKYIYMGKKYKTELGTVMVKHRLRKI